MESAKLRDGLTDFDRQRNILIIQGICMDTADRSEIDPLQLSVTFHNYCEFLVKNGRTKEISNLLSSINRGIRQRFNSAINKSWTLDELIIRNRLLLKFYSIIHANMRNQENTYGLGIDGIYNNLAKNHLDVFQNNTIVYTFIPTEYYSEKSMATAVWDETLKNNMIINIILDKPIPQDNIIINPDTDEPISSFIPVILSELDITSDIPCFYGEIISEPDINN